MRALGGDPRTDDLAETVEVHRGDVPQALELPAHGLRPWLRAEEPVPHPGAPRIQPLLAHGLADVQCEGRRAREALRTEILEEQDLPEGVARGYRHHGEAHVLGPIVEAEPAREETVAVGDLEEMTRLRPRRGEGTGHHLAPDGEIAPRVADHGGLALGARGGVHARELALQHGEEAPRIVITQIRLDREGQAPDIVRALDPLRIDAGFGEGRPVERYALRRPRAGALEPLALERAKLLARGRLDLAIPDHVGG